MTSNQYLDERNQTVRMLRALAARERRWLVEDPDEDRRDSLRALEWAAQHLEGLPENWITADETTAYEELRKRATRLIVAMRRDRWEGHDHEYANDLASLLNVGSPSKAPARHKYVEPHPEACEQCGRAESDQIHEVRNA